MNKSINSDFLKNGFLLVEVLVTIVVLSAGVMFLVKAFSVSMASVKTADNYSQALLLSENKITQIKIDERLNSGVEKEGNFRGDFGKDYEGFSWEYNLSAPEWPENLTECHFEALWSLNNKKSSVKLATYLNSK